MATQSYISELEEKIIAAKKAIWEISAAIEIELKNNGGTLYKENRDHWGTLKMNLHEARFDAGTIVDKLERLLG